MDLVFSLEIIVFSADLFFFHMTFLFLDLVFFCGFLEIVVCFSADFVFSSDIVIFCGVIFSMVIDANFSGYTTSTSRRGNFCTYQKLVLFS